MNPWINNIVEITGIEIEHLNPARFDASVVRTLYGLELPGDYLEFITTFGVGSFYCPDGGPIIEVNDYNDRYNMDSVAAHLALSSDSAAYERPENWHPVFPNIPGRFPWGWADSGHTFFWLVDEKTNPDSWKVVSVNGLNYHVFDTTMCAFLYDVFSGGRRYPCWSPGTTVKNSREIQFRTRARQPL